MARNVINVLIGLSLVVAGGLWAALELGPKAPRRHLTRSASEKLVWLAAWALLLADVVLSLTARPEHEVGFGSADKLVHFSGYLCLSLVFLFAAVWRPGRGPGRWPHGAAAVTLAVAQIGTLIEFLQSILGRDAELLDVVANIAGGVAGLMIWRAVMKADSERRSSKPALSESTSALSARKRAGSRTTMQAAVLPRPKEEDAGLRAESRHLRRAKAHRPAVSLLGDAPLEPVKPSVTDAEHD